jgi:hypothetical protein
VQVADPLDPNLTLVPGSVNVSPLAGDDTFQAIGNVTLSVASPGLLANDTDFLGDTFTITSPPIGVPTPTTLGGTVTVQANGTFTYTTPAGANSGTDTFTYTLTDSGGLTGNGTVSLDIAGRVWFVKGDVPGPGTGTQADPFRLLSAVNGAGGAGDPDAANDFIYLYETAAAVDYTGGLGLEAGQHLVGSGSALVVGTTTVLPAGTPPTVVNTGGNALTLASGATIEGLTVNAANNAAISGSGALGTVTIDNVTLATSSSGGGLNLQNVTSPVTMSASSITGTGSGGALVLNGGNGAVDLATTSINKTAGRLVDVQNRTGGAVTLGGVTGTGAATDAIVVSTNTASTVTFGSGLSVTTTSARGLLANGGGTIAVSGTASTISATGGAALDVTNTTLNATFASVSSATSAAEGIRLASTVGAIVINGGSVTNPTTQGISISGSSANVTFSPGAQVSGTGAQRILVTTSTGTLAFGNTTVGGGTDGISLQNNSSGSRTFGTLAINTVGGIGFLHANGGGATTVTGATTITNPTGTGVDIQGSTTAVNFNGVTVGKTGAGVGVNLANNTTGPSFGALGITTANGAGLVVNTSPLATSGGSISAASGPAINATSANFNTATFATVTSSGSATNGISLVTSQGTLTMSGGSITTAAGTAFNVSGGSVTASYGGSVTQNAAQRAVDVQGTTGGAITVATVTGGASSTGVNINAANGNVTFTTLNLGTSGARMTNQAVTITNGTGAYALGTVGIFTNNVRGINASGADGTINSTAGTVDAAGSSPAIDIDGPVGVTTLGMTLTRVDVNGASSGIRLLDTNGTFTVAGAGSAGSGGTLNNTTSDSIVLTNAAGVSLSFMNVSNSQESGILGSNVSGLSLTSCSFTNNGNDSADAGVRVANLSGVVAFTNTTITGSALANVHVDNTSGTLSSFTISGGSYSSLGTAFGGNSILLNIHGTSVLTAGSIQNAQIVNNKPARGITIQAQENGRVGDLPPATANAFVIQGNTFTNNGLHSSHEAGPVPGGHIAVRFLSNGTAGTPMTMTLPAAGTSHAVNNFASSATTQGSLRGRLASNFIGSAGTAGSGSPIGNGVRVLVQAKTAGTFLLDANVMRQINQARGIDAQFLGPLDASGGPQSDITVTNNDVNPQDTTGFPLAAIYVGADSQGGGATTTTRADVRGNTVPTGGACGGACDVFPGYLIVDEVVATAAAQLVDNAPASGTCAAELAEAHTNPAHNNTGQTSAAGGCALIAGPIVSPP